MTYLKLKHKKDYLGIYPGRILGVKLLKLHENGELYIARTPAGVMIGVYKDDVEIVEEKDT